ncbi:MAG: hypothetical protein NVSMB4_09600 [Acidimicrobiales bacterium]
MVLDQPDRQRTVVEAPQLRKRGPAVEQARLIGGDQVHSLLVDAQAIALGLNRRVHRFADGVSSDEATFEVRTAGLRKKVHRNRRRYTK